MNSLEWEQDLCGSTFQGYFCIFHSVTMPRLDSIAQASAAPFCNPGLPPFFYLYKCIGTVATSGSLPLLTGTLLPCDLVH